MPPWLLKITFRNSWDHRCLESFGCSPYYAHSERAVLEISVFLLNELFAFLESRGNLNLARSAVIYTSHAVDSRYVLGVTLQDVKHSEIFHEVVVHET